MQWLTMEFMEKSANKKQPMCSRSLYYKSEFNRWFFRHTKLLAVLWYDCWIYQEVHLGANNAYLHFLVKKNKSNAKQWGFLSEFSKINTMYVQYFSFTFGFPLFFPK